VCVHQQFLTISQYSDKGQITAERVQNIPADNEIEKNMKGDKGIFQGIYKYHVWAGITDQSGCSKHCYFPFFY
jgi:hypothetical protein